MKSTLVSSAVVAAFFAGLANATCTKTYTVVSGDSCTAIPQENSISTFQLTKLNPDLDCNNLQVDQVLCVEDSDYNCQPVVTVVSGDSCFGIAQAAGISVDTLIANNPEVGSDCNLFVDQVLCVANTGGGSPPASTTTTTSPTSAPTPPTKSCTKAYSVVSGDSCDSIASSNGISSYEITFINPGLDCSNLQVDQSICIADPSYSCQPVYTVVSGDSCFAVADSHGITLDQIFADNPQLTPDCPLFIGESLCVADQ